MKLHKRLSDSHTDTSPIDSCNGVLFTENSPEVENLALRLTNDGKRWNKGSSHLHQKVMPSIRLMEGCHQLFSFFQGNKNLHVAYCPESDFEECQAEPRQRIV